jgi:hypothetical protein
MSSADKRYHVIISERAVEMLVQHARFLAQVKIVYIRKKVPSWKIKY